MKAEFTVRILDESYALLAWAKVEASPRPQERGGSCPFWPEDSTQFTVDTAGRAAYVSIHWHDLDVARLKAIDIIPVVVGQVVTLSWDEPIWLVPGMRDVPLPEITEKGHVVIGVPVGTLTGRGTGPG